MERLLSRCGLHDRVIYHSIVAACPPVSVVTHGSLGFQVVPACVVAHSCKSQYPAMFSANTWCIAQ